jgi:hypothetical protein
MTDINPITTLERRIRELELEVAETWRLGHQLILALDRRITALEDDQQ